MSRKGFSTVLVMILAVGVLVVIVAVMRLGILPDGSEQSLNGVEVEEVSESSDLGVVEKEIEETAVEFPDDELKELESEAASLMLK